MMTFIIKAQKFFQVNVSAVPVIFARSRHAHLPDLFLRTALAKVEVQRKDQGRALANTFAERDEHVASCRFGAVSSSFIF